MTALARIIVLIHRRYRRAKPFCMTWLNGELVGGVA